MNYQNQVTNFQPAQNIGNSPRLPFKPFINNNTQPNQPFHSKPAWQPQPTYWQQNPQPSQQSSQINFPPPQMVQQQQYYQTQRKCYHCGDEGHLRNQCPAFKKQIQQQHQQMAILESAAPPVCYNCREIGHKSFECPLKRTGQNHPNLPGPPLQKQGNQ